MWVLRIEPVSSGRTSSVLHYRATLSDYIICFLISKDHFLLFCKKKQRTWLESYWLGGPEKMVALLVSFLLLQKILQQKSNTEEEKVYLAFQVMGHYYKEVKAKA